MFRILFNLPLIIWRTLLPIRIFYRPSTEEQRKESEKMRNTIRLADYRTKKVLFKIEK